MRCDQCNQLFIQREHMVRHQKAVPTSDQLWNCWVCSVGTDRPDSFGYHLTTHALPSKWPKKNRLVGLDQIKKDILDKLSPAMGARCVRNIDTERRKRALGERGGPTSHGDVALLVEWRCGERKEWSWVE